MFRRHSRALSVLAATTAALAVGAAPALAGEDDDGDDDESAPAQTAPSTSSGSSSGGSVPVGGVATGAGGTAAAPGTDGTLVGLATGALVLVATGGGLVAVGRRR